MSLSGQIQFNKGPNVSVSSLHRQLQSDYDQIMNDQKILEQLQLQQRSKTRKINISDKKDVSKKGQSSRLNHQRSQREQLQANLTKGKERLQGSTNASSNLSGSSCQKYSKSANPFEKYAYKGPQDKKEGHNSASKCANIISLDSPIQSQTEKRSQCSSQPVSQKDLSLLSKSTNFSKFQNMDQNTIDRKIEENRKKLEKIKTMQLQNNEEYEKLYQENQETLGVNDQELIGQVSELFGSGQSSATKMKMGSIQTYRGINVTINPINSDFQTSSASKEALTEIKSNASSSEELEQIEKDPETGSLPLPIQGIKVLETQASSLLEDIDPVGQQLEQDKKKMQVKEKQKKKTNFKFR